MKICVAQIKPKRGDIQRNINNHKKLINIAVLNKSDMIVFPELSLTGYEPELSKKLAIDYDDNSLNIFQEISNTKEITIAVGMPTKKNSAIYISMIIFQSHKPRLVYSKQYLHEDEYPYFSKGNQQVYLTKNDLKIAFGICYELSIPQHSENAFKNSATIYITSVAKTVNGVEKAVKSLSNIAHNYSMTVLMSNCIGKCDNFESSGTSSVWNNKGLLVGQLNDINEGILILDTNTNKVIEKFI